MRPFAHFAKRTCSRAAVLKRCFDFAKLFYIKRFSKLFKITKQTNLSVSQHV